MNDIKDKKGAISTTRKDGKQKNEMKESKKNRQLGVKDQKSPKKQRMEKKPKKDPNQPKRPLTAFFVFLEEFRKSYKEKHPNVKGVTEVGKAGGDKWKEMSNAEKALYLAKAAQKKLDYDKSLADYKQKQNYGGGSAELNDDDESEEEEDIGDD